MTIIYLLLPLSVLLAIIGLLAYLWSVRSGQFDDLDTPPLRMLVEDESDIQIRKDLSVNSSITKEE